MSSPRQKSLLPWTGWQLGCMPSHDVQMPDAGFVFLVEQSFKINGRGVAVVGSLVSGNLTPGDAGIVQVADRADVAVARIEVEWLLQRNTEPVERPALLLRDLTTDQVPRGAVIRSSEAKPAGLA